MQHVNFYQEAFRPHSDPTDAAHLARWLLLVAIGLALVSGAIAWRADLAAERLAAAEARRDQASARLADLRARLESLRADAGDGGDQVARLRAELAAKQRLLDYLRSGPLAERDGFSGHLRDLARRVVDGVWLERITLAEGGARMRLDGHATDPEQVPALMAALGEAEAYRGHRFRTLDLRRPEDAAWRIDFVLASDPVQVARGDGEGRR